MRVNVRLIMMGLVALPWVAPVSAPAQQVDRHGIATASGGERALRSPMLQRVIAVDLRGATLAEALQAIARLGDLKLLYGEGVLGSPRHVTLRLAKIRVSDALAVVLRDTGLEVTVSPSGQVVIAKTVSVRPLPQGAVMGRVTDSTTGRPVVGADVFLENTRWRAATDTGGGYLLAEVDTGSYRLTVRRLGYAKQSRAVTVAADRVDTVNMLLKPVTTRLDELVTTVTGRRRRIDIANDVTTINADSVLQTAPIRSVADLLEGRVPGLVVQRTSGAPGDPSRLRLRGAASPLRSNDPIVVVDGIRVYAEQSAARSANLAQSAARQQGIGYAAPSPLDYINPNSIETIEVLKGPSAATLYGQDAANGVIIITTKKGKAGPARWTARASRERTTIEGDYPNLLFSWGHLLDQSTPVYCPISGITVVGRDCQADSLVPFQILNDPALTMLANGHRTAAALGVSGGSATLTYAVTSSYQEELGLPKLPAYEFERYQARVGASPPDWMQRPQHLRQWEGTSQLTAQLGGRAALTLRASLSRTAQQRSSLEDQLSGLMTTFFDRGTGTYYTMGGYPATGELQSYFSRVTDVATSFTNGVNLDWRPRTWLTLRADAGLNVIQRADELFLPHGAGLFGDSVGQLNAGHGTSVLGTVNLGGNAVLPLGWGFQARVALGANYVGTSIDDQAILTYGLAAGTSLLGSRIEEVDRNVQDDATFGWYLEPSIGNSRINFSSGLRLDGGSSYGGANNFLSLPAFPKLGFSYLVSDEPWFPLKILVHSLRVRVAYGRASRQPGPTDRFRLYGATQSVWADGQYGDGVFLQTLGNTAIRPERTTEMEGGFDVDLLDNRLTMTVSGYRKTTDDALLSVPVPQSVYGPGVSLLKNIGVIRNTGVELAVGASLLRSRPVTWRTDLQVSQNRNLVVALGPGVEPFYITAGFLNKGGIRVAAGYPLFGRWSLPVLGYADANGNQVLEASEILLGDTAVYTGQTLPNYTANLFSTVSLWRGAVTVNAGFLYDNGLAQRNGMWASLRYYSRGQNDPTASLPEQAAAADLVTDYNNIQTVSTFRFNSLAVTYQIPQVVARRLGTQTLSVSVQGANLGLWSNYRGLDPGVNAYSTGNDVADLGVLPQPRRWQVQVNATY